ncbi:MAG TPA: PAS domain-containing protein [Candidatus Baltobacteraceae bacterium]|nr:PAS domain-containing protein [Candidatus Baltobacteraceae bacterium]
MLQSDATGLLERITDGFFALDASWRIVYMNAQARELLRAQDAGLIGTVWLDAFPRARGTAFEREYVRAMQTQQPVQFTEFSATSQKWLEVKAYPSPDGISVYFRDTTARMKAERELEARSAQLQALIGFGRLALAGTSTDQLVRDAMELLQVYLDVPIVEVHAFARESNRLELLGSAGWGEYERLRTVLDLHSQAGESMRRAQPVVTADVRTDARFTDRTALDLAGVRAGMCVLSGTPERPVGVISAYTVQPRTFVTNDVRFVESVATICAEAAHTLEQKRRVHEVLESITDAFAAVDRDLNVTLVNHRIEQIYQRPRDEIVGRPLKAFMPGGPGDENLAYFEQALRERVPVAYEAYVERLHAWFETRIYPAADGLSVYLRDITERKLGEMRLQRMVAERTTQLELANKELESFAYSVSHDLRAPLRAIDGFSLALEEDYGEVLDDTARSHLRRVRAAAGRMAKLIDALLTLAKVARTPIKRTEVNLSKDAQAILADLQAAEPDRRVDINVAPGIMAYGEPALLHAVLLNLLGNAWKFTRKTAEARIEFTFENGEYVVRDNGAGFDMAYANKLFGAFQRLHGGDEYEGTGIGLATVARIVHRHGGDVRAHGAVGAGAVFSFTVPQMERA